MMGERISGLTCRRRRKHDDDFNDDFTEPPLKFIRQTAPEERKTDDRLHLFDSENKLLPFCRDAEMETCGENGLEQTLPVPQANISSQHGLNSCMFQPPEACVNVGFSVAGNPPVANKLPVTPNNSMNGLIKQQYNSELCGNPLIQEGNQAPTGHLMEASHLTERSLNHDFLTSLERVGDQFSAMYPAQDQVPDKKICVQCAAGESGHFHHIQSRG